MSQKTNSHPPIINHGLIRHTPKTQFAYLFLFLAAPMVLACAVAFLHLTGRTPTQIYQMLWLCVSLLVPSFFAGLSFWLLSYNGKYKIASLLTCVSYIIMAALTFVILMNVEDRFYKADAFFLLGILVFGFLITLMTTIILSIAPDIRYGKLSLFVLVVLLAALFLPVKQAMQDYKGYSSNHPSAQQTGQMPPSQQPSMQSMQEAKKFQAAIAYAFKQNFYDAATLCNIAVAQNHSPAQGNQPAALAVGKTAADACIPMRYADVEAFTRINPSCCTITNILPAGVAGAESAQPPKEGAEYVIIQYKYNELNQQQTATYVVELNKQGKHIQGFNG